jgi:hypothetical protein
MRLVRDQTWSRRGVSLLWNPQALSELAPPQQVMPIRAFIALAKEWPDELPSAGGKTLVVAGTEGILDTLMPDDAERWLEEDLKPLVFGFQEEYEGQAGLVLWLPSGKQRVHMTRASENYFWHCAPPAHGKTLALGRILWGGAEADVGRILDRHEKNQDFDGPAWIGLHHPRVS